MLIIVKVFKLVPHPTHLVAGGMPHIVGKLLMRATYLLEMALRSEFFS